MVGEEVVCRKVSGMLGANSVNVSPEDELVGTLCRKEELDFRRRFGIGRCVLKEKVSRHDFARYEMFFK